MASVKVEYNPTWRNARYKALSFPFIKNNKSSYGTTTIERG
jgi:hypothetical protein